MFHLSISLVAVTLTLFIAAGSSKKLNVLFLAADDMRPEIGAYVGNDFPSPTHPKIHTPNLDKLASRSLLLKRAYVQQAVCSPSRTSLLTGRRPDTTHVYDLFTYFREVGGDYTTIPGYFKQNGYNTVGMGKIFHPGVASGDNDPISWSEPYIHTGGDFKDPGTKSWVAINDSLLVNKSLIDMNIAKKAVESLRKYAPQATSGDKPFFIAAGFHRPHLPFVVPQSFLDLYPEEDIRLPPNPYAPVGMPPIAWSDFDELRDYVDIGVKYGYGLINTTIPSSIAWSDFDEMRAYSDIHLKYGDGNINTTYPDSKVKELRRAYYAAVSYTDSLVGQVVDELDKLGLTDSTIVSFWGDHGWQLGEHGEWCKHTNFELSTHAPMMVSVPGVTDKGVVTEQLTEFVDLFPTLAEAAGLDPVPLCPEHNKTQAGACTEGVSFAPLMINPNKTWKQAVFSQYPRMDVAGNTIMGYTMRTDRFRYTEWVKHRGYPHYTTLWSLVFKDHSIELYDHSIDPEENHNRAYDPTYKQYRGQLSSMLHKGWRDQIPSSRPIY